MYDQSKNITKIASLWLRPIVQLFLVLFLLVFITSCQWGPKQNEFEMPKSERTDKAIYDGLTFDLHQVRILEVLPGKKYMYLKVKEGPKQFWIASMKGDIYKDSIYYYKEALLKTNFESQELVRVFDSIYFVTKLKDEDHGGDVHHLIN